MGYLKGRFCSLCGLQQQIDDAVDHARAVAWIKACLVLHTLVFEIENGNEDPDYVQELVDEGIDPDLGTLDNELEAKAVCETRGQGKRTELKEKLFEYLDEENNLY